LWTAFTGFATVAAVAFFAAWSVLSNIFCSLLIFIMRPFRLLDYIELIEGGDKPGLRGRVIDVNLVYTTLEEIDDEGRPSVLQVPNNLFFQRTTRRWRPGTTPPRRPRRSARDRGRRRMPRGPVAGAYQVSMKGRLRPDSGARSFTERRPLMIQSRVSSGSITASISVVDAVDSALPCS